MIPKPVIAITAGDPCGIGPEVVLKALDGFPRSPRVRLAVIGDSAVFERTAKRLHHHLPPWSHLPLGPPWPTSWPPLTLVDCGHPQTFTPGRSSRDAGAVSFAYLDQAVALWRAQCIHALVTAPVTKWAMARVQPTFVGQTEYLARAMRTRAVVMMFVSDRLRVVLLTRHVPLSRVAQAIDQRLLKTTLRMTAHALCWQFGIRHPRLALCGLNPHAGEEARCGKEERDLMRPVLRALRHEGMVCDGPFAADGFFACLPRTPSLGAERRQATSPRYDAIVCGYHDQGLIPFKMVARDQGAQMSIGLPIVRTSPDHGSALDIAGRGLANPGSMIYALKLAIKLVQR